MSELQNIRETINKIDKEMAALFERRMDAARAVAAYKKEKGLLRHNEFPRAERN